MLALRVVSGDGRKPDCTIRISCGLEIPRIPGELDRFDVADGVCYTNGKSLYIDLDGSLVVVGSNRESGVDVWIRKRYEDSSWLLSQLISQALAAAMRRCGLFLLHAAGVRAPGDDKAILVAGDSGAGKSTITFQLASFGWGYLSDDVLLLSKGANGTEVRGLRRFFALTADTLAAVELQTRSELALMGMPKRRLIPEEFFPAGQIDLAFPGAIIFPSITKESQSRIQRLSVFETMTRLLRLDPWSCFDKATADEHLNFFANLARETVGFEMQAGKDLLGNPALTAELVASVNVPVR